MKPRTRRGPRCPPWSSRSRSPRSTDPTSSFGASSTETFPLASFMATSMKSLHVLMGLEIWLLSTIHPVVPQSLHTECLLSGSQGWFVYAVSMFAKFGIFERSNSSSRSFSTISGMKTPVGTTMSYPLVPAAAVSFAIASSFEAYTSIEVTGPSSSVNRLKSFGSSYCGPVVEVQLVLEHGRATARRPARAGRRPGRSAASVLLLHAESRKPPPDERDDDRAAHERAPAHPLRRRRRSQDLQTLIRFRHVLPLPLSDDLSRPPRPPRRSRDRPGRSRPVPRRTRACDPASHEHHTVPPTSSLGARGRGSRAMISLRPGVSTTNWITSPR